MKHVHVFVWKSGLIQNKKTDGRIRLPVHNSIKIRLHIILEIVIEM